MSNSISKEHHPAPLTFWTPMPEGIDSKRVDAADKIIRMGNAAICKATRAGFTTSAVIAAERRGLKVLVVAPTRNILTKTVRETVKKSGGIHCDITGHSQCKYVQELIKKDPLFKELPILIEDRCDNCEDYETCPVTEIERVDNFTTATITYSKLESVMISTSESAAFIREKLADINIVIFDEAHVLSFPNLPQVDFDKYLVIPDRYGSLRKVYKNWLSLRDENRDHASEIEFFTEQDPQHYTGFAVPTNNISSWQEKAKMWGELISLAKKRTEWDISASDILALRDIISIMSGLNATISYIEKSGSGRMVVSGCQGKNQHALEQFLKETVPKAKIIFVSGTLVERGRGFFSELSGRDIKSVVYPDLNDTNHIMQIHPSTWRYSKRDGRNGIKRAIEEVRAISDSIGNQPIILFAMNTKDAAELKKRLKDLHNVAVDYYKSANSIGVAQKARICIAVGAAELPRHACDPLAQGKDDHERYFDSQKLRINEVHTATWQAWSRVKDPDGLSESHVYCVGIRAEEAAKIVTWGTKREVEAKLDKKNGLKTSVKCEEYLGRPNIAMEERSDLRPCRRTITDYVDAVVPISEVISERQKSYTFPYNNIVGETVRFSDRPLRLFNRPISSEEFEQNFFSLTTFFVSRIDKCGLQWKHADSKGNFGYYTGAPTVPFQELIMDHLFERETIALPPYDLHDNCYFCALDFDDHAGDTPQSYNVKKLTGFLDQQTIPSIVVKSGSNDGYHVFIPLFPTQTFIAYKFIKQLVKDAGLEDIKPERLPASKSCKSTKKGYGKQIKLPLAYNWKADKKSVVVDPHTLEPVEFVEVTHAIKLRDIPEPIKTKAKKAAKTTSRQKAARTASSQTKSVFPSDEMRPCIREVIESKVQLEGGEGHAMRVAIAAEALRCGLSEEQAIDLFRSQDDFDEHTTLRNIQYIWENDYRRYSCETLQDKSGSFVKESCRQCPFSNGDFNEV